MTSHEKYIKKLANSVARKHGFGIATDIIFDDRLSDVAKLDSGHSYYYTTQGGIRVHYPSAYRRKALSANLIYNNAQCVIRVNKKCAILREFGELI